MPASKHALQTILAAALRAADAQEAIRRHTRRQDGQLWIGGHVVDLQHADVRVIAAGKAGAAMASALLHHLGDVPTRGVVVTKHGHASGFDCGPLTVIEAGHPVPDDNSVRGGLAVCAAIADSTANTVVLACISGGASALLVTPHPGISLKTMQAVNGALLASGADITELNAVRSRLDQLKAGGLVRMAQPAQVYGLILSDVIGDPIAVIASGLTHNPAAHNVLVGNNTQSCEAAARAATALGFAARVVTTELRGEAAQTGRMIAHAIAAEPPGTALIYGGETTVTLGDAPGLGGRSQELALAAAAEGLPIWLAAFGTDGTDGPTDAAGAVALPDTLLRARAHGLDPQTALSRHDSYPFFNTLGDLIVTGPTGTNVADVVVALR
jgi:glycerate 2-kinase